MASTGGNDTVTNKQLYDELTGLRADLKEQFDSKADVLVTDDHETRIRSLERFRYAIPSVAFLAFLVSAGFVVYSALTT